MGICESKEEKELKLRSEMIDRNIRDDGKRMRDEVKMLLLGSGESGKSTILKQMRLIHTNGYTEEEKKSFREIVFSNVIYAMKQILEAMQMLQLSLKSPENEPHRQLILDTSHHIDGKMALAPEVATAIAALWKDQGVKACFARSAEYQLIDSAKYYFDDISRISRTDYIPTEQDILRARVKTTSIIETKFVIGGLSYRLFDVGGQRSERKKWIHCFENVTAILFLVAISEYDQVLYEDKNVNRLNESCALFDSICNSKWFTRTSMILFLNKKDLFAEKLQNAPLNKYCTDYAGANDYESASKYMSKKFSSLNKSTDKQLYIHFTCATDTDQIKVVMEAVYDTVVQANLRLCGLV